ncbi:MAG: Rid family detoxifying hydrolase [Bacteroidia bacterium]|nr:Rid family detoxifying hydrolase [Bacteroidia bacterium]
MKKYIFVLMMLNAAFAQDKKVVFTESAPVPIGAYSQGVKAGKWLFVSGQIGMDKDGKMDTASVENQTRRALENIKAILEADGLNMDHVVKATIYLKNINDFAMVNKMYASYFKKDPPARETVEVCRLPKNAKVEISVIALAP